MEYEIGVTGAGKLSGVENLDDQSGILLLGDENRVWRVLIASGHALYGTFVLRICSRPKVATKPIRLDWSDQIGPSRRSKCLISMGLVAILARSAGQMDPSKWLTGLAISTDRSHRSLLVPVESRNLSKFKFVKGLSCEARSPHNIDKTYIGETHYKSWLDFSQHASIPRHHPLCVMSPSTIRHVIIHQITYLCLKSIFCGL
jgi:hypothetical protein